ncbi:MFS transporter [Glycocaulis sp.]|uniref:MFS transporter n=1 Tax=Glycocaulis sp. TaxID=1969725 RepID=UPI003D19EF2E
MNFSVALHLLVQKRFGPLVAAQALGAFNDNLFRFALVNLATFHGLTIMGLDRELMVPVAATALTLPIFLFSAVAGQVADRYDRAWIMRRTKLAEVVLMLAASVGFFLNNALLLVIVLFFMGMQSAFFAPARNAAIPTLLKDNELVTGNALVWGTLNVAILGGAGLAALFVISDNSAWLLSATLAGVALIGFAVMCLNSPAPPDAKDVKISWNIIGQTFRVMSFAFKAPDVLRPLLGVSWFWMLAASVVTLMPLFTAEVLGGDETVGFAFTGLFTIGAALGAILCGLFTKGKDALGFTIAGAFGLALFPAFVAFYTLGWTEPDEDALLGAQEFLADARNWPVLGGLTLSAMSAGLFMVPLQAMAQRRADPELRGRVLAAGGIMNAASASLGQFTLFVIGLLTLPLQTAFAFIAIVSGLFGMLGLWRLAKRRKSQE